MPKSYKGSVHFTPVPFVEKPEFRPVQQRSAGCHLKNAAPPKPCHKDFDTVFRGLLRRVVVQPPQPDLALLAELKLFVEDWISTNLLPLAPESDLSIETWLSNTNYPSWRKQQLLDEWKKHGGVVTPKSFEVKGFVKEETYPEYKHARGINARTDLCKVLVGPIFKLIEKEVFKHPSFIKKIPKTERAKYIYNLLYSPEAVYFASDYTSYESHFVKEIFEAIEFPLYRYMTKNLPCQQEFDDYLSWAIAGDNFVKFEYFTFTINSTRMTGEMNTSLGNGFANLMCLLFIAHKSNAGAVACIVEGDDSLFRVAKPESFDETLYLKIGFTIKLERHIDLNTASFCGNVFDPVDLIIITDIMDAMNNVAWLPRRYVRSKNSKVRGLLRSRALSLLYEYSGCPVLQAYALYILRCTLNFKPTLESYNSYINEQKAEMASFIDKYGLESLIRVPGFRTRMLVEQRYGITVEHQLRMENYLNSLTEIQEIDHPIFELYYTQPMKDYYSCYVRDQADESIASENTPFFNFNVNVYDPVIIEKFNRTTSI
jgi:hypothetical protein